MFTRHQSFMGATIGRPVSLGRGNIDPATFKLTFVYFEQVQDREGIWQYVQNEALLVLNEHYRFDKRRGLVELLDHPFWQQEGLWRAADRKEPLLYKGQVKWPQVILFDYEYFEPEPVITRLDGKVFRRSTGRIEELEELDMEAIDEEALQRLGYNLPKFMEADDATPEEMDKPKSIIEWE